MNKNTNNSKIKKLAFFLVIITGLMTISSVIYKYLNTPQTKATITYYGSQFANTEGSGIMQKSDITIAENGDFTIAWEETNALDTDGGIFFRRFNRDGSPKDVSQVLVNNDGLNPGSETNAQITGDKYGNFIIVWRNISGTPEIYYKAYDYTGTAIGAEAILDGTVADKLQPDVTMDYDGSTANNPLSTSNVAFVWSQEFTDYDIAIKKATATYDSSHLLTGISLVSGVPIANENTSGDQLEPQVAMNNFGQYVVTWSGSQPPTYTDSQIWMRAFANNDTPLSVNIAGSSSTLDTKINSDNILLGSTPAISAEKGTDQTDARDFSIAYYGEAVVGDSQGIFARMLECEDVDLNYSTDTDIICVFNPNEISVNSTTNETQTKPRIDSDALNNFIITWEDNDYTNSILSVMMKSYKNNGVPLDIYDYTISQVFAIGSFPTDPSVAVSPDGTYVLTQNDTSTDPSINIQFQQFVSDTFKIGGELVDSGIDTESVQKSSDYDIAPNGNSVTVWKQPTDGNLYFILYDSTGSVISGDRIDTSGVTSNTSNPRVSFFKDTNPLSTGYGRFIVAWDGSHPSGDGSDVIYLEYNADGTEANTPAIINTSLTGDQNFGDIAAGYYDNDADSNPEDIFVTVWQNDDPAGGDYETIETRYHQGNTFFDPTGSVENDPTPALSPRVNLNPINNRIIYTWDQEDGGSSGNGLGGVWGRTATGSTGFDFEAAKFQISPNNSLNQSSGNSVFINNDEFVSIYSAALDTPTYSNIYGKRYLFNTSSTPTVIDNEFLLSPEGNITGFEKFFIYPSIAADYSTGDFLVSWSDSSVSTEQKIYGQYFEYFTENPNDVKKYGTNFEVNSTRANYPSAINPTEVALNNYGIAGILFEGTHQVQTGYNSGVLDKDYGVVSQLLNNPLYEKPVLESLAEVTIDAIRTIRTPSTINFPSVNASTSNPSTVSVNVRDQLPTGYIEIEDLATTGAYSVTVAADNFTLGSVSYIQVTNLGVKNCDADLYSDITCVDVMNGNPASFSLTGSTPPGPTDYTGDDTSSTDVFYPFNSTVEQKTLATGAGDVPGRFRFYPSFQLTVPPFTPPGSHSTTLTFSLI